VRYADQIDPTELPDYPGDVAVSMTVAGSGWSSGDARKFEQLQSAQLRIDMLQGQQMYVCSTRWRGWRWLRSFRMKPESCPPLQNLMFRSGFDGEQHAEDRAARPASDIWR